MQKLPSYVSTVLETLETGGYQAYLVGGCVRDLLMGRCPKDFDIATSAMPEVVIALFSKTIPTGIAHGTVTVLINHAHIEVTTFRRDGDYQNHRRPEQVTFVDEVEADLARRDFTMNAIAMSKTGELIDPFDGRGDIQAKIIRSVGDPCLRFEEDALRMFRAFRFSAQLGFRIEAETLAAIKTQSVLAQNLSAERVRDETQKILCSDRPEILADVLSYGLLDAYASSVPINRQAMEEIVHCPDESIVRWCVFAAILLYSGAIVDAKVFLKSLRLPRRVVEQGGAAAHLAHSPLMEDTVTLKNFLAKHFLAIHGEEIVLLAAEASRCLGHPALLEQVQIIIQSGECYRTSDLAIGGNDLLTHGIAQGAEVGEVLQKLLAYVIKNPEKNIKEDLLYFLNTYKDL